MKLANQGTIVFLSLLNDGYTLVFYKGTQAMQVTKVNGDYIVSTTPSFESEEWIDAKFEDWIPVKLAILALEPLEVEIT